jgi:hypothetical protein
MAADPPNDRYVPVGEKICDVVGSLLFFETKFGIRMKVSPDADEFGFKGDN